MLGSLKIKNFKGFKGEHNIDFAPLTLILGKIVAVKVQSFRV